MNVASGPRYMEGQCATGTMYGKSKYGWIETQRLSLTEGSHTSQKAQMANIYCSSTTTNHGGGYVYNQQSHNLIFSSKARQ
ncbi:hypothetical protein CEXT_407841 [Caerostris extrusa]|uniref:Uncharacterized protein n=1 Tax=Caerostris extrusa TaxID=172846 RepID=A0AAV4QL19_CAEEX|nr:hypothetical protein CEXT_407841 [Caerostris extrusa]